MLILKDNIGLYTDRYELTMAQGYFFSGQQSIQACFDYFFRKNPYDGGYTVFAGLADLLDTLEKYRFGKEDIVFLETLGYDRKFIDYLKKFRFKGNVYSIMEGEVVFPNEPILRVEGNIIECQLIESLLLNILNFQSLIATKASRIRMVAGDKQLIDFGFRRAQGLGAIHASRAAIIGGFNATSNTFSALQYGLKSSGTMAHSWIQFFENELDAFRNFVSHYPNTSILLVDTYDTLKSGIPNAVKVAKELEKQGNRLFGIRLDSGDLAYLSKIARKMFDESQLEYIKIVVSNQIDEYVMKSLLEQKAPIDGFGIGTALVTGKNDGALDGVYKLSQVNGRPTMKFSENISKMTLPGIKNIYRYFELNNNLFVADGIEMDGAKIPRIIFNPIFPDKYSVVKDLVTENIISHVMEDGIITMDRQTIDDISGFASTRLKQLPLEYKRFTNPHVYKVGIGSKLKETQTTLKNKLWMH